jgi:hypothetical protein
VAGTSFSATTGPTVERGVGACPPRSGPPFPARSRAHGGHPGRVTTRCGHRARVRATTSSRPRARGPARRWPPRSRPCLRGTHPGHRHARRGRRARARCGSWRRGSSRTVDAAMMNSRASRHPGMAAEARHHQGEGGVPRPRRPCLVLALARASMR